MLDGEKKKRAEELSKVLTTEELEILGVVKDHQLQYWDLDYLGQLKASGRHDLLQLGQDFLVFMLEQSLDSEDYHERLMMLIMELAKTSKDSKPFAEKYRPVPEVSDFESKGEA